jgi:hypothetical protein
MNLESSFSQFFTSDAFDLISNYITNLKNYLIRARTDRNQQEVVINGIFEFISEYVSDYKNCKLNFSETLKLIEDIGSPSEIVQSLDIKSKELTSINENICTYCKSEISQDAQFCEVCGRTDLNQIKIPSSTNKEDSEFNRFTYFRTSIKQSIIDKPYSRSFLLCLLSLTFLISIYFILDMYLLKTQDNIIKNSTLGIQYTIFTYLGYGFLISLVLSLPISIIYGIFNDLLFKDFKSKKFHYYKLMEQIEGNLVGGFLMVIFGITFYILMLSIVISSKIFIENFTFMAYSWLILTIGSIFPLVYYGSGSRPYELNLTQLNILKYKIDKRNSKYAVIFYKKYFFHVISISVATCIITVQNINWLSFLLGTLLYYLIHLLIINGLLTMKMYS